MSEKIYFHLLIVCGILCHGIIATLSDDYTRNSTERLIYEKLLIGDSSDLLVREKRVISHLPDGLIPTKIEKANYVVSIKQNSRAHCAGVILTNYKVITTVSCVSLSISNYAVLSGSSDARFTNEHHIKSKSVNYGNLPHHEDDGIALITVDPPFVFSPKTGFIRLHVGPLPAGTQVTVTGWGCKYPINPIPGVQRRLRTIVLPIMNHEECRTIYHSHFNVTEKYLCTYDENQYCAHSDKGAPLVFENHLVGIHVWKGELPGQKNPDVFINLQRSDYTEWIREHIHLP